MHFLLFNSGAFFQWFCGLCPTPAGHVLQGLCRGEHWDLGALLQGFVVCKKRLIQALSPLLRAGSDAGSALPLACPSSPAQGDCHFPGTIFCLHSTLSCPSHAVLGFSYYSLMCLGWSKMEHIPPPRFWLAWGLLLQRFTAGSLPWCWSLSGPMPVTVNEGDEQSVCMVLPPCINTPSRTVRVSLVIWLLLSHRNDFLPGLEWISRIT